ncbi:MAG: DUF4430 domain-containing protein [Acutalibacteraceae bacterium]|jgi:hypothetical protein
MKKTLSLLIALIMTAVMLAGCGSADSGTASKASSQAASQSSSQAASSEPAATSSSAADATDVGEGSTVFAFEVTDNEKNVTRWNVHTDETIVGKALLALKLINGSDSEYGLMVTEVNGLTADYNTDKAYWAFYIDGEYASAGVDSTTIEQGKTYAFVYTKE